MSGVCRGEIYYIEPHMTEGSEQRAGRPAIIVSNDMANSHSPVVEVVYLTTQPKIELPTHVPIKSAKYESIALCEQITSVSKNRIGSFVCTLTQDELEQINAALLTSLALESGPLYDGRVLEAAAVDTTAEVERDIYKTLYENLLVKVLAK